MAKDFMYSEDIDTKVSYNEAMAALAANIVYNFGEWEYGIEYTKNIMDEHMGELKLAISIEIDRVIKERSIELVECNTAVKEYFKDYT